MFPLRGLLPVLVLGACALGCGGARYVSVMPNGGVVAIPANSNTWPFRYRKDAEKLMAKKCPGGYVIDREEEVVIGQTTTNSTNTDSRTADLPARRKDRGGSTVTNTESVATVKTTNQTEWRIHFRAKDLTQGP